MEHSFIPSLPNPFPSIPLLQASIVTSQERLQYVAAFGDKKEYIALIELQLNRARYSNTEHATIHTYMYIHVHDIVVMYMYRYTYMYIIYTTQL